jgi:MFS family permease
MATVSLLSGVLAVRRLLRAPHPLLRLRVLRVRTFRLSHAGGSLFRLTVLGLPFLLPLLFQVGFGWSPIKSGLMILCVFAGNIAIKPATSPLLRTFGFRPVLLTAVTTMAVSIGTCALLTPTTPLAAVGVVLAIGGVARSVGFSAYNTIAFSDVAEADMSAANTLASTIQQLALGLGVAVGSIALRVGEVAHRIAPDSQLTPYRVAFVLIGLITATALVEVLRLPHDAGAAIGGGVRSTRRARV